ncbi:SDR family NAD(P)-dependent oxidoreductase [Halopseudomonas nanhaiensis]|uniref:SDR family NAD(P)-dependent oxidoreductase n=1 Tax=Halopseudomonas nanhaiensis TaxID=2830842 RepID=UPI001CC13CF9|nr:SDR family NAD(P)-dependent oxidoreductase [Halopseudomonas nanhaiensis]UAX00030.1 SDR family NAD(P)-dependent oxidoreductase [Halopseudomonas nanhaiensis]
MYRMVQLRSFGDAYRALVIGGSGALGGAFCDQLDRDPACTGVTKVDRRTYPDFDLERPESIASLAQSLRAQAPYDLIILATGILHGDGVRPEKSLSAVDPETLQKVFQINALGPAMILRHCLPLLHPAGVMALLSAKVGSIEDNRLGGWYAYRASKAALNMLVKTAAIELARQRPQARLLCLHPGTVVSKLSEPFRGAANARPAAQAAAELLAVVDGCSVEDSGGFFSYSGERLPW